MLARVMKRPWSTYWVKTIPLQRLTIAKKAHWFFWASMLNSRSYTSLG